MKTNITRKLKKFMPILLQAQKDNLNEANTSQRVFMFFEDVLGYNPLTEISKEVEICERYADFAVKIDGLTKFLVEIKPAAMKLRDRHIEQCEHYASKSNLQWVLLTNGVTWNLYHLTFGEGIEYETAFTVTLCDETVANASELLGLLHRNAIIDGDHEVFWKKQSALSPKTIASTLFLESVLLLIRREIRREEGTLIDPQDLAESIHNMLDAKTKELVGPAKIHGRKYRKRAVAPVPVPAVIAPVIPPEMPSKPSDTA